MAWKQIITKDIQRYSDKLHDIASVLSEKKNLPQNEISLMGGKTGIAVFLFYYAQYTKEDKHYDYAMEILSDVFEEINNGFTSHTFARGLAGIGWVLEHLSKNNILEVDTNNIFRDLDPYIYKTMMMEIDHKHYDFLHGAIGSSLYFQNRLQVIKSTEYINDLLNSINYLSEKEEDGAIKWISVLDRSKETMGYNLSLSHGMTSIILFLSKIYQLGINQNKSKKLINGAVKFLFKHTLNKDQYFSIFPNSIGVDNLVSNSRLAWCYGDLGIGNTLWLVSKRLNNNDLGKKAIDIILHSTKRKDLEENRVLDAGLCHGTAGIAHIYNRMYNYTGREEFNESALFWFDETIKMAKFDNGLAGYKAWQTVEYGGLQNKYGFLEGVAGIGLALLSAVTNIEPKWDECLLLS